MMSLIGGIIGVLVVASFCIVDLYRTVIELRRQLSYARADIRMLEGAVYRGIKIQSQRITGAGR